MLNDRGPNIQKKNLFFIHINTKKTPENFIVSPFPGTKKKWRTMQHHRNKTN